MCETDPVLSPVENGENPVYYTSVRMGTPPHRKREDAFSSTVSFPVLKSVDLFAGIGGIRLAFESAGARCVFSSECDRFAAQTYEANFGEKPAGDIREIVSKDIPEHDVLTAGFPCQPFSISGVSKKGSLGKPHGFDDPTQGTLFFEVKRVIRDERPSAFFLENVKHHVRYDGEILGSKVFAATGKASLCRVVTGHAKN